MSSAMFMALIVASELVSASNHVARPNHIPRRQTASDDSNPNQCLYPSTLVTPTGYPTPAPDVMSALETVVDACNIGYQPASITSDYNSFTSAYNSWVNANSASLLSLGSFLSSYQASVWTQPQCTQYTTEFLSAVPPQIQDYYFCGTSSGTDIVTGSASSASTSLTSLPPTPSSSPSASTITSSSSAGTSSSSARMSSSSAIASSSSATITTSGVSSTAAGSSTTASAASNTNAARTSFRADGAVSAYFLIAGATLAISAFVGMIAL